MANLSIFQGLLQPPKSVADYDLEAANVKRAQLQNSTLDSQNQASQRGAERANQLLALSQNMPKGATDLDRLAGLRNAGFYDEADKLSTSLDNRSKTQAVAAKDTADAADTSFKTQQARKTSRVQAISQFTNAHDAIGHIADGVAKGDISEADGRAMEKNIPTDPAQFGAWQLRAIQSLMKPEDQAKFATPDANTKLTATTSTANNAATNARVAAEGAANRGVSMRGQNLTDARSRETNAAGAKAPPGYAWGPTDPATGQPTMIAVKGGPADQKLTGALNADTQALNGSTSSLDRLGLAANEVLNHPGLKSIYGLRGVVPNVPGGEAADAQALLNTLKSQVGFGVLQDMRNNSKTGGALGAVSDKENAMLQANLAALEKSQSAEQAQASLRKIIDYSEQAKERMRAAYNLKHSGAAQGAPAAGSGVQSGTDLGGGFRVK